MEKLDKKNAEKVRERILALIDMKYESDASFEREVGLAPKTVNNWRRRRSSSFMKMLPQLAEEFELGVGEILDMPIKMGDSSELSADEEALLNLYRKTAMLSPKQRANLAASLESVINLYLGALSEKSPRSRKKQ